MHFYLFSRQAPARERKAARDAAGRRQTRAFCLLLKKLFHVFCACLFHAGKIGLLVWIGTEALVHEDAVSLCDSRTLEGQRDQIAQSILGERILRREQPVI